ncbi:MAG: O-antigen ligase family protein [Microbacteriaceae bacterium]|nr:O-antigen ligase family protein [Microbacteriaceae bacterium]
MADRRAFLRTAGAEPGVTRSPVDAVSYLTVFLFLLIAVPTEQTIGALGSIGSPALLWAVGGGLWWCWQQLQRQDSVRRYRPSPVKLAAAAYLAIVLISYAGAMFRGLPDKETSPADAGLLKVAAWVGFVLFVSDGIPNRQRLLVLLRRLCMAVGLLALLGLLQFATKQSLIDWLTIPGLSASSDSTLQIRSGFARSSGTASHPLEYGFVLTVCLPIALSLAISDTVRSRIRRWMPVTLIAAAAVLAVSRSTMVGILIGLVVLVPTLPTRLRLIALGGAAAAAAAVYLLVPGLVGTIRGLFSGIGTTDASTASRVGSYDLVAQFISRSPLIGRGAGTFLPQYWILDNQILQSAIEIGLLGVSALLGLCITAFWSTIVWRGERQNELGRRAGHGVGAGIAVGTILLATFDVFSFPMATGVLFLLIGTAGAHHRIAMVESRSGTLDTELE